MPELKSKKTSYVYDLDEVKKLIADNLNKKVEAVSVEYVIREVGGDQMDRYPGTPTVTEIKVTIDETKV